ncbi:hypothetical protein MMC25_000982 [Agyrium rufum]|nr:hypothetical protein [Agyrium rufum]
MASSLSMCREEAADTVADLCMHSSRRSIKTHSFEQSRGRSLYRWTVEHNNYEQTEDKEENTIRGEASVAENITMPVSSGSQSLLASLPSFMSVFGDGLKASTASSEEGASTTDQSNGAASSRPPNSISSSTSKPATDPSSTQNQSYLYRRRSSTTFKSESTDSSPTTTISTADSTLTEPSPSSSPESPVISLTGNSFSSQKSSSTASSGTIMEKETLPTSPPPHLTTFSRSESPSKKMRNMKNLSLNTGNTSKIQGFASPLPRMGMASSTTAISSNHDAPPASPSFILPPKASKRKPSSLGLTITTPETHSTLDQKRSQEMVPQTPAISRLALFKHVEGTSSMPLFSPSVAPEGGMRLPPFQSLTAPRPAPKARPALSLQHSLSFDSVKPSPIVLQTLDHVSEDNEDVPLSREVKSPAYPDGPVCIYDPDVYLYLEPNDTEAMDFDVIINVAREVRNPFEVAAELLRMQDPKADDAGVGFDFTSEPLDKRMSLINLEPASAVSEKSFQSAFETMPSKIVIVEPKTPRGTELRPEYLHVPWDHNTNVVDDLLRLCELIDARTLTGKKVLVHCQCGVSRSASLIVAYGLYKNPELTVQEAYDSVKAKSRWIGPNMHLIYQLAEFKALLSRRGLARLPNQRSRRNLGMARGQTDSLLHAHTPTVSPPASTTPKSEANSEPTLESQATPRSMSLSPPHSAALQQAHFVNGEITPGPASAPPNVIFSPSLLPSGDRRHSIFMSHSPDSISHPQLPSPPPRVMEVDVSQKLPTPAETPILVEKPLPPPPESEPLAPVVGQSEERAAPLPKEESKPLPLLPGGFASISLPILKKPASALSLRRGLHPSPLPLCSAAPLPAPIAEDTTAVDPSDTQATASSPQPADENISVAQSQKPQRSLHMAPILPPSALAKLRTEKTTSFLVDAPPSTPGLLSPRAQEFTMSPFHRTVAGDLAGSCVFEQTRNPPSLLSSFVAGPARSLVARFVGGGAAAGRMGMDGSRGEGLLGGDAGAEGLLSPGLQQQTDNRRLALDPRSPPQRRDEKALREDVGIFRSIDDVL